MYCVAFSPKGDIIATGSNDKVIKVLKFDEGNIQSLQDEMELAIHSATVRDLTFVNTAGSLPLLASGGAGKIDFFSPLAIEQSTLVFQTLEQPAVDRTD